MDLRTPTAGRPAVGTGRWAILAGAWAVYAAFGLLVATTGALVPAIQADLGVGDTGMGFVLGAWQLVYIGSSIPAGRLIDRFGLRRALLGSMVVMLVSGVGRAAAWDGSSLFLFTAVLGLGAPIISVGAPKVAASLFEGRDRRLAVGVYSTAPGIGTMLGLALPANVVGPAVGGDWRSIMLALTALAASALVVWAVVSRRLDQVITPGVGPGLADYRTIARIPVVRFVLAMSIVNFFVVHGIGQWLVTILATAGWSLEEAGSLAAFGATGTLAASFVLPRLATPRRRPFLMVGALLAGAVALWFLSSTALPIVVPSLLVTTVARSALMPLLIMSMMDHRDVGPERIAAATGLFFTAAQIGGVAGPAATGALAEASGGFALPLAVHSAVMVFMAGLISLHHRWAGP
ncbi:MAG: MFS transporter [Actinomycetota bacterium]